MKYTDEELETSLQSMLSYAEDELQKNSENDYFKGFSSAVRQMYIQCFGYTKLADYLANK